MKKIYFLLPLAAMLLAGCNGGGEESHATGLSTSGDPSVPSETSSGEASTGEASTSQGGGEASVTGDDISTGYGFVLGGRAYALTENINKPEDEVQLTRTGRYLVEDIDLTADVEFYFTNNGQMIADNIGGQGDDAGNNRYNNWKYTTVKGVFAIAVTSLGSSMEFATWKSGGFSFWTPVVSETAISHGTEPGGGGEGGGGTGETGFGIVRAESLAAAADPANLQFVKGVEHEKSPDGKDQWLISAQSFTTGNVLALYDFKNATRWTPKIDNENIGEYITVDAEHSLWSVNKAFTADIYVKLQYNNDSVWFQIAA